MNPLKIIHCANFSQTKNGAVYYSIDNKITNGLIRNGHFVHNFSYRDIARSITFFKSKKIGASKMNISLIETIRNIEPDILLLGHSEIIYDETLKTIKKLFPKIKILMWWVDPLINIKHIIPRLELLDAFFATTGVSELEKVFGEKYKNKFFYMPNCCDTSIEKLQSFNKKDKKYDLLFLGRYDDERNSFVEYIKNNFKELKIGLFGNSKETIIQGQDFFNTLINTKIGINYSRFNDIDLYSSDRIIQLLANGVFTLSPRIPNMELLFNDNEVIYFEDFEDFEEKVSFYIKNEKDRNTIAINGYKKAIKNFNSTRVTKFMIEAINQEFTEQYEWLTQKDYLV